MFDYVKKALYQTGIPGYLIRQKYVCRFVSSLNTITGGRLVRKAVLKPTAVQRAKLIASVDPRKKTVAFCYPYSAYRDNLGDIVNKLRRRGYNVLELHESSILASVPQFDGNEGLVPVAGGLWGLIAEIVKIDAYVCLAPDDNIPKDGRIIMFVHDIHDSAVGNMSRVLKAQSRFDYFFLPSRYVVDRVKQQIQTGRKKYLHSAKKDTCLIGGGYPKLDGNRRYFQEHKKESKTIIFATTNLLQEWKDMISLTRHGSEIIETVLSSFPEYDLIFRPHPNNFSHEWVQRITTKYSHHPRFTFDDNVGSYMESYSKSALMITDMSGTAYTYAFTTLRPVVFFSPNEPEVMRRFAGYQYFVDREKVGYVAENVDEMVEKIRLLLATRDEFSSKIREYRDSTIYNIGKSEDYFVDNFEYILEDKRHPDWIYI